MVEGREHEDDVASVVVRGVTKDHIVHLLGSLRDRARAVEVLGLGEGGATLIVRRHQGEGCGWRRWCFAEKVEVLRPGLSHAGRHRSNRTRTPSMRRVSDDAPPTNCDSDRLRVETIIRSITIGKSR